MKTDGIKFITIASSNNRKVTQEVEERSNQRLIELYKQFQKEPFSYAKIDYFEPNKSSSFIKNIFKKIKNIFRNVG